MNPTIEKLIEKGRRSFAAGEGLLARGDCDFAVSRVYYAMFYLAQAVLLSKGLAFSKHSAVIAAFGREFVKPGHLPAEMHEWLRSGFDERNVGDYGFAEYPPARAGELLAQARTFIERAEAYLRQQAS